MQATVRGPSRQVRAVRRREPSDGPAKLTSASAPASVAARRGTEKAVRVTAMAPNGVRDFHPVSFLDRQVKANQTPP